MPPDARSWWEAEWEAIPTPAPATQPKLISLVSTAETRDAEQLAQLYIARWPHQENVIRDWLLPLGLDTNHGYAKMRVENSKAAKQHATLEQRRDRLHQWAESARIRLHGISKSRAVMATFDKPLVVDKRRAWI